jgi:hypothetical protein
MLYLVVSICVVGSNNMNKNIIGTLGVIFLTAALLLYLSKPDRGGFRQCVILSGIYCLDKYAPKTELLWWWKPRYRFYMASSKFESFKVETSKIGFQDWVVGDGQFGSFNEFSVEGNELYYSKKEEIGKLCLIYYRPKTETLDVIIFYH